MDADQRPTSPILESQNELTSPRSSVGDAKTGPAIAVVGMACFFPGARTPLEFWENILTRRQQFRRIPDRRLPLSEYGDPDRTVPDTTDATRAAIIDGFIFDSPKRRIPKGTVESADMVQWLALEVALGALEDAGLRHIDNERAGVVVGNTLTGEQTRATAIRLRWPFVRRAL